MEDKKNIIDLPHRKASDFVTKMVTGSALSVQPDGTHQLTFTVLVTDLLKEHLELKPIGDGPESEAKSTGFETETYRESVVRILMAESVVRDLLNVLVNRLGVPAAKKNGGGNG